MLKSLHTKEEILNKEFKKVIIGTGYDMNDVDSFLDEIIEDYKINEDNNNELKEEIGVLEAKIADLNKQLAINNNGNNIETRSANNSVNTNMDILKRLSNLEQRVFGNSMN